MSERLDPTRLDSTQPDSTRLDSTEQKHGARRTDGGGVVERSGRRGERGSAQKGVDGAGRIGDRRIGNRRPRTRGCSTKILDGNREIEFHRVALVGSCADRRLQPEFLFRSGCPLIGFRASSKLRTSIFASRGISSERNAAALSFSPSDDRPTRAPPVEQ